MNRSRSRGTVCAALVGCSGSAPAARTVGFTLKRLLPEQHGYGVRFITIF
ncbi:hypothetical protein LC55x_4022 [Lysobacter capsici]|uniref:Uncharacterized protein n=1 Tax=Lysobacter capsici AZ78 TaxID=1444315 RepID=A0A108UDN4_9GAMM|nr:hypothetical protein LC55x_4022 [Lysobacter capsici]KWS06945.1 hypothetical protein AZ78_4505 [Lysobacter capsici AZ78]